MGVRACDLRSFACTALGQLEIVVLDRLFRLGPDFKPHGLDPVLALEKQVIPPSSNRDQGVGIPFGGNVPGRACRDDMAVFALPDRDRVIGRKPVYRAAFAGARCSHRYLKPVQRPFAPSLAG